MARVHVYRSNRAEVLVETLADVSASPLADPFAREWFVVPGRGMAVWLSMQLARQHGVFAAADFLYPRNFVERVHGAGSGVEESYSAGRMTWALMAVLDDWLAGGAPSAAAPLLRYFEGEDDPLRRFRVAQRLAMTFDQYLTYRGDMVLGWEAGNNAEEAWQAVLWRELCTRLPGCHLAAREHDAAADRSAALPQRVFVFGVSSLPPLYARTLAVAAKHADVHLFLLSPCREYWADLARPREGEEEPSEQHFDLSCPLLASLGKLGADFMLVLADEFEQLGVQENERELYQPPEEHSMLAALQRHVLTLTEQDLGEAAFAQDGSIALHSCHGPMREVEVLQDQLLALLSNGDLEPHEIVVMMSDVDTYAPMVEAVFGRLRGDPRFIPYRVSDRAMRRDSPVVEALHRLLALVGGRARASELLDLLSLDAVQRRFCIAPDDVDTLADWVVNSGVRWGIDEEHRQAQGQPAERRNTWRFGLDRLLLGFAMPGQERELFAGVLPFDDIEGQGGELLGKLAQFSETLFGWLERLATPRNLASWSRELNEFARAFLIEGADTVWEHQRIAAALEELASLGATFDGDVAIEVVRVALEDLIDEGQPVRGFLSGGVTFCAMVPMRSIPFRVVCLLGMSDGAFPRRERQHDFDLLRRQPRRGDRRRRDDDRYLFLETVLSARDRLLISYVGQSIRDGAVQPPSVVVSELFDAIARLGGPSLDALTTEHPLQPFSPRYFAGGELFSYAEDHYAGAQALASERLPAPPLFEAPLDDVPIDHLAIDDLLACFQAPIRYLFRHRLGVDLRERIRDVADREPLELDALERYSLGDRLLELSLANLDRAQIENIVASAGMLPPGAFGSSEFAAAYDTASALSEQVRRHRPGQRQEPLSIRGAIGGIELTGELGDRFASGIVRYQYARAHGKHALDLWIRHLLQCWTSGRHAQPSTLIGRGGDRPVVWRFEPLSQVASEQHLALLLDIYQLACREPLLLFPRSSMGYADRHYREPKEERKHALALREARKQWRDERSYDLHLQRLFERDPFELDALGEGFEGPNFAALSLLVFAPLLSNLEEA